MRSITILIALLLVSACSNKPYAVIDGSMSKGTDANNYDVYITSVDGQLFFDNARIRNVEPGFRLLRLSTTKPDRKGNYTYATFPIVTKPCVRYYVSAQHESNLRYVNDRWDVVVLKEEAIESCEELLKNREQSKGEEVALQSENA